MNESISRSEANAILGPDSPEEEIDEILEVFHSIGVEVLLQPLEQSRFPRLAQGPKWDFLTLLGDLRFLEAPKIVGIVGRRDPTDRGRQYAYDLAAALGGQSIPTLSGMARGIDRAAHQGSLSVGGPTVAAIPEGLLRFLRRHKQDYPNLQGGSCSSLLVVAGVRPWERWSVGEAMRRNGWIANWCESLVVVEANPEGGTWRTAEAAANAGKPIWVCTGFDHEGNALGNERLADTFGAQKLEIGADPEEAVELILAG